MENIEIARVLQDVADLLEIKGSNPFRIRAYRNAAQVVAEHGTPLRKSVAEGADLTAIPSIGKDMARHIEELVTDGELSLLAELSQDVPLSLIEIMRLPGLGAKRAKKLWEELEITNLDELEAAAEAGDVAGLAGFGRKTQEKILSSIGRYRKREGRVKLGDADQYVMPLVEYLKEDEHVQHLEVAGSYRRRRETVRDIDLLAISDDADPVMRRFASYPDVQKVESSGGTRSTVLLKSGLQVDLRVVPPASHGAALAYFTGSKEHNVAMRKRAIKRGLRLSEYGVFRGGEGSDDPWAGEFVGGGDETEVYAALDLPWIPPELRENRGEIDAAERGELPKLISVESIRGDLQMHSTWSDGKDSLETMLEACVARGYEYFAITDHSKALAMTGGMDAAKLSEQWVEINGIRARHSEIRLLRGMEVDILAGGELDLEDEMLEQLDMVLISVHSRLDLPGPQQTERIIKAIQHPSVHILAHPTGRQINRRDPMQFDLDAVMQCAAENDVAVELNAHPDRLDLSDVHLMRAREIGCEIVISTDAHKTSDLDLMRYGVEQARRAWLQPSDVLNTLPFEELAKRLGLDPSI
ncbi:MAG: DNA polymerase/3'-5' exonuclease PolX [Gemmatimonadota bacterium]|nr:MAG: DNA polymerase/3'-5' exonuclease PolX [Gemmatimonadota bacterium]